MIHAREGVHGWGCPTRARERRRCLVVPVGGRQTGCAGELSDMRTRAATGCPTRARERPQVV